MWPTLLKGHSMVAVARPRRGKTLGYLLPLLQSLLTSTDYPTPPDEGPLAVILSPTRKKATAIATTLEKMLNSRVYIFLHCQ